MTIAAAAKHSPVRIGVTARLAPTVVSASQSVTMTIAAAMSFSMQLLDAASALALRASGGRNSPP